MRKEIGVDADAHYYKVIDLDTGKEIRGCVMADDNKGIYCCEKIIYEYPDGGYTVERDALGGPILYRKKGNIKLIDSRINKNPEGGLR